MGIKQQLSKAALSTAMNYISGDPKKPGCYLFLFTDGKRANDSGNALRTHRAR